ncbi:MAG: hypothetical protein GYA35_09245, partial [Thermoanaerobaculaceae bacterium]|nr:hypothetical protein [Thermoanaerobaculaceae bacterium]
TGYRLYRGLQSNLADLLSGNADFCTKYQGANTNANISADDPSLVTGRCYYYLVTAYNGAGEGSAGNASGPTPRQVNTAGNCP